MPRKKASTHPVRTGEHAAFVERLRDAMHARGLSQAELSRRLEVTESTVSTWFRTQAMPSGELMSKLPAALRVSGHWLLTGDGHKLGGVVEGDPGRYARAVRKGALMALAQWRDNLNAAERYWNAISEDELVTVLASPEQGTPPWAR